MKVVQVVRSLGLGGAERVVVDLAHALVKLGEDVSIAHIRRGPGQDELLNEVEEYGITVRTIERKTVLGASAELSSFVRQQKAEVVHSHLGAVNFVPPLLLSRGVSCVHTLHNTPAHIASLREGKILKMPGMKSRVSLVALSPGFKDRLSSSGFRADGFVVPNGINAARLTNSVVPGTREIVRQQLGIDARDKLIAFVGRAEPQKATEDAVRVCEDLPGGYRLLLLLSGGSQRQELEETIAHSPARERIHVVWRCDNVPAFVSAADVLLMTSRWEGMPIALIEGMYLQVPIVATAVGAIPFLIRSGVDGFLCETGDTEQIAERITQIAENPSLATKLASSAFDRAEKEFSAQVMARRYAEIYRQAGQVDIRRRRL